MATNNENEARKASQDDKLVEALASGLSYRRAGELAGVHAKTVQRRMEDPVFARRVTEQRNRRTSQITGLLADVGAEAVGVIREALSADKGSDRLRAAHLTLTMLLKFTNSQELEERVAELERLSAVTNLSALLGGL
ncbi:MAG: hypothetical protein WCK41_10110 [Actinomycetes bacterium]